MGRTDGERGFTLVEVLIALGITALVSAVAYSSLSTAMAGVERTREVARRTMEVNRAWAIISRDIRQFVPRPVRDEFGEEEPAISGGPAARFPLSLTRTGWHNSLDQPRGHLQRVAYRVEDGALWRDAYQVLDRAGDTVPLELRLLEGVEFLELAFLPALDAVEAGGEASTLDTRNWADNWVPDTGAPGGALEPPLAVEVRLQLEDWGEIRRLYALPPL